MLRLRRFRTPRPVLAARAAAVQRAVRCHPELSVPGDARTASGLPAAVERQAGQCGKDLGRLSVSTLGGRRVCPYSMTIGTSSCYRTHSADCNYEICVYAIKPTHYI